MAVVFLQGSANSAFSATVTRTATLTNVAGNLGLVVAYAAEAGSTFSIADTQTNTWVPLTPLQGISDIVQAWYCLSLKVGSNIVTTTDNTTGSVSRGILFGEWTVSGGTIALDKQGIQNQNGLLLGGQATSPSVNLVSSSEILIGYFISSTVQASFTAFNGNVVELTTTGQMLACITDQQALGTTGQTQAVTLGTNGTIVSAIGTFAFTASTFSISGNAGVASANVAYSGGASGNVTADGSGNYTISGLSAGSYTITPSLSGFTFSPTSQPETIVAGNITGVNFTATANPVGGAWSPIDSRQAVKGFGPGPNAFRVVQGSDIYDVQTSDNSAVPGMDSRATKPVDCRIAPNIPQNSRAPEV